ncbi:hypothetical protein SAOR_10260 [Salinisphaera orenii MK-B5]|uniref:Uncharacterized protein n=1 Tax=Salinisphaera orenii MK-B5 TaxID=856730 RepID=A0A423PLM3_9GAMM|nr:hypothetical protein SAOR_10260 [Salinisphaera orenii MK-B5]
MTGPDRIIGPVVWRSWTGPVATGRDDVLLRALHEPGYKRGNDRPRTARARIS